MSTALSGLVDWVAEGALLWARPEDVDPDSAVVSRLAACGVSAGLLWDPSGGSIVVLGRPTSCRPVNDIEEKNVQL